MKNTKIYAVHLLNDRSGSPLIFRQALAALVKDGHAVQLLTSNTLGTGFLSAMEGIQYAEIPYSWSPKKWRTLLNFLYCQCYIFIKLWRVLRSNDTVYINAVLPFGAALAGKIKGARVIYHLHEVSIKPLMMKRFLLHVVEQCADQVIYVSEDLKRQLQLKNSGVTIPNALSESFTAQAFESMKIRNLEEEMVVFMACSLKKYKGVDQMVLLAKAMPQIQFEMVLNASQDEIGQYFEDQELPKNLTLFPQQKDMHPFYSRAHVVLNLSLPDQWIETFGMTALEAMAYGRPVIVPTVGGISDLIEDGKEGFKIDGYDIPKLVSNIEKLRVNLDQYNAMSAAANARSKAFSIQHFEAKILEIVSQGKTNLLGQPNQKATPQEVFL